MTADVELLPCGECGMPCRPGEYHPYAACLMFKTCRNSDTVRGNLQDAQDHATAEKDAEIDALRTRLEDTVRDSTNKIEALRAEAEKLRALAACAYQMAGMHDAPLVWLDRLSEAANGDALPDVDTLMDELLPYQPDAVCEAEARADKLAEALREARRVALLCDPLVRARQHPAANSLEAQAFNLVAKIDALLRDQEEGSGQ